MLSRAERILLTQLINDRIAALPPASAQVDALHRLCTKIKTGGEFLTAKEIQRALNVAGEPDNRHCRWVVYASDVPVLADILNAMQVQYATSGRDTVSA